MKTLLRRKTIAVIAAAAAIALVTIISVNVFNSGGPVTGFASFVTRPFRALASAVTRTFEDIYGSIYRYEALQQDYEDALRELATVQRANRESEELRSDNDRLHELFGFKQRNASHVYEEASIMNWNEANWSSSFVINRGYENSETQIAVGNSIITEYGALIGQITAVGATSSTAVSVLDTTFAAGAYVGDGSGSATAKGDFTLMGSGRLMIDFFTDELIVLPGDSVVTSGAGGVFPVGLVIGEVTEVRGHSTGVGRYAVVTPSRAIDHTIADVYVITGFDISD